MKKSLLAIFAVCLSISMLCAQSPDRISYQVVVRDADNNVLKNTQVKIKISINRSTASGFTVYSETHTKSTNRNGLATLEIGGGTRVSGSLTSVSWRTYKHFIKTEIDPKGGNNYTISGTTQLVSVPYALNSKTSEDFQSSPAKNITSTNINTWNSSNSPWAKSSTRVYYNGGNVGLGTSSPKQKLDIRGRLNVESGVIQRGGTAITRTNDLGLYSRVSGNWMRLVTNNGDIRFFTAQGTYGTGNDNDARMTIAAAGNVGVGTPSPNTRFHVNQNTTTVSAFRVQRSGNTQLVVGRNGNTALYFNDNPSYRLQLNTNSAAKPSSSAWSVASDARLKKDVKPYESGLKEVLSIRPVWYTYNGKAGMPAEQAVGVIAQELQKVAPYMVHNWDYTPAEEATGETGAKETYLGVDNGPMTYMLINAVKEQQAQIESLKKEIEDLKKNK